MHTYILPLSRLPVRKRREYLAKNYGFRCMCDLCRSVVRFIRVTVKTPLGRLPLGRP
jgi:hypothetical protein